MAIRDGEVQYILLCRHAPHENGRLKRKKRSAPAAPSSTGVELDPTRDLGSEYPTQDVARVLREELLYEQEIKLRALLYAPTPESIATATLLRNGLALNDSLREPQEELIATTELDREAGIASQSYSLKQCKQFNPALRVAESNLVDAQECIASYLQNEELKGNAVLVVGHQPQLSWLSDQLTGGHGFRQWRRLQWWCYSPIPISPGEIVCLRIERTEKVRQGKAPKGKKWSGHLLWSIHPDDSARLDDIREKVQSKLKTAELLAAVLGLAIAAVLALLLDRGRWRNLAYVDETTRRPRVQPFGLDWDFVSFEPRTGVQFAVAMLLAALAMYLMTVYAYDSLRMPPSFWTEHPPHRSSRRFRRRWLPRRPPSSSAWIIYRNMMRIWGTLFVPATLLVLAAFTTLAISLLDWNPTVSAWLPGAALLAAVLIWKRISRPVLGSED